MFMYYLYTFCKQESKGASEAQSQGRWLRKRNKRESLASSSEYSMGSPSYGTYTSYEKIPRKHVSVVLFSVFLLQPTLPLIFFCSSAVF